MPFPILAVPIISAITGAGAMWYFSSDDEKKGNLEKVTGLTKTETIIVLATVLIAVKIYNKVQNE